MKWWEKAATVALGGLLGWEMYGLLRCPICRAESERAGSKRVVMNHKKHREQAS